MNQIICTHDIITIAYNNHKQKAKEDENRGTQKE